jgi:arginine decarboxylase
MPRPSRSTSTGRYICVYPIKVNQQRQVVEEVLDFGRRTGFGLEAGSKPELLAVVAMADNDTPIICNGFKDAEFIEMAMLAQKIGRRSSRSSRSTPSWT